jgi:hypothetical protein
MTLAIDQVTQLLLAWLPMILVLKWSNSHILKKLGHSLLVLVTQIISPFCINGKNSLEKMIRVFRNEPI